VVCSTRPRSVAIYRAINKIVIVTETVAVFITGPVLVVRLVLSVAVDVLCCVCEFFTCIH
jgi:hypothetical protein